MRQPLPEHRAALCVRIVRQGKPMTTHTTGTDVGALGIQRITHGECTNGAVPTRQDGSYD